MRTLRQAANRIDELTEAQRRRRIEAGRPGDRAALVWLANALPADKGERILFLEELLQLELPDTGPVIQSETTGGLLRDWIDFLRLQGTPTHADFDRETWSYTDNPASRRWHELEAAWGWPSGWTGRGLPPQLLEG